MITMQQPQAEIETELRQAVARKVGDAKFGLWFGEGVRLGIDGDALEVGVPNGFFREWIRGHFSGSLVEAAESVAGRPLRLTFKVDDEIQAQAQVQAEAKPKLDRVIEVGAPDEARPASPKVEPPKPPPSDRPRTQQARPAKRLDDFIAGPGS